MFSDNMHKMCHMEQHMLLSWVEREPSLDFFS